jgi:hypothetical protein
MPAGILPQVEDICQSVVGNAPIFSQCVFNAAVGKLTQQPFEKIVNDHLVSFRSSELWIQIGNSMGNIITNQGGAFSTACQKAEKKTQYQNQRTKSFHIKTPDIFSDTSF